MPPTCIFCKIAAGEAPATVLYQDELAIAFRDIHPVAQTHVLVIPRRHIESVNAVEAGDESLLGHLIVVARKIAEMEGIAAGGYRLLVNTGPNAGQVVYHIHLHVIGGQRLRHMQG